MRFVLTLWHGLAPLGATFEFDVLDVDTAVWAQAGQPMIWHKQE